MWRFAPGKRQEGAGGGGTQGPLEGRAVDVGKHHVAVRQTLAQGGFAFVYLACCQASGRQFALKHIVCGTDKEILDATKKEVAIMRALKGHPNVVTLVAHSALEGAACLSGAGGGSKKAVEYLLLMELCEKTLGGAVEARGGVWWDEKTLLLHFRDVCNGLFALHCQSPPVAHRDIKVENVLLGSDGAWKLCDFGSATTRHGRIDRLEDMGVEEDVIRKTTTPAYRAPEMWDLYQREVLSEKVDIWALGCLLFRLAFFRPCFDGESKLQVLNGRYSIPEACKFSPALLGLIRDMLAQQPSARPTVMEIWRRVNALLPPECRAPGPDRPAKSYNGPVSNWAAPQDLLSAGAGSSGQAQATRSSSMSTGTGAGAAAAPVYQSSASVSELLDFGASSGPFSAAPAVQHKGGPGAAPAAPGSFWAAFGDEPGPTSAAASTTSLAEEARSSRAEEAGAAWSSGAAGQGSFKGGTQGASWIAEPGRNAERRASVSESAGHRAASGSPATPAVACARGSSSEELKAQVERLQGNLKKMVAEREELRSANAKLTSQVEVQAQEISQLKARLGEGEPGRRGAESSTALEFSSRPQAASKAGASTNGSCLPSNRSSGGAAPRQGKEGSLEFQFSLDKLGAPMVIKDDFSVAEPTFQGERASTGNTHCANVSGSGVLGHQTSFQKQGAQGGEGWQHYPNNKSQPQGWANF